MSQSTGRIHSHWHSTVEGFHTDGKEFYHLVKAAVEERQIPDVKFSVVDHKEGGFATAKRQYLRVQRGALVFDICTAPFGTGQFFSWWLVSVGPKHPLLYLIGFMAAIFILPLFLSAPFVFLAFLAYPFMLFMTIFGLLYLARKGTFGPEEHIRMVPVIGWLYERLFGAITYFSEDTRQMFQDSIHQSVQEAVNAVTAQGGAQAAKPIDFTPTIRDLTR